MAKMNLKVKVNDLHFSIPVDSIPECIFGANLVLLAQIYEELLYGQAKMAKITLKVKVNDLYFQYQSKVSQDACLVQIWWF